MNTDSVNQLNSSEDLLAADQPHVDCALSSSDDTASEVNESVDPVEDVDVAIYSAESDLRDPVKLLRSIGWNFYRGRELAWRLFVRNLMGMYRQTLLGLFWAFLPPLANTAIWVFLNAQKVISFDEGIPVHYAVYVLTGMVLWQAFIDALQMPLNIVQSNRNMISKLNFPRESLLMVGLSEVLFNLLIRLALLVVVYLCFGVPFQLAMVYAVVLTIGLMVYGCAIGLFLMPIGSLYHDVRRLLVVIIPFWMIVTPIVYPTPQQMPGQWVVWLNPVGPILVWVRDLFIQGDSAFATGGLLYLVLSIPLLAVGLIIFRISMPTLVERMPA